MIKRLIKRAIKSLALSGMLPATYRRACRKTDIQSHRVLFIGRTGAEMPNSFRVLYDRLSREAGWDVEFISMGYARLKLVAYYQQCLHVVHRIAEAEFVVLDDANDVVSALPLRPDTHVIQLWHACGAFKKWGMSTAELRFGGSAEEKRLHPFYENLDLVTVSSPEIIWAYAEAMDLVGREKIIKPLGTSRTDVFFDESYISAARKRVHDVWPTAANKRVIVYAPTFRGSVKEAAAPDELDIARLHDAVGADSVLLIKHHPFVHVRPEIPFGCEGFARDVSEELSIEDLLCRADLVISDYSSLVFEYSLFERPMVFFAYDKDDYDDWRGFYYEYEDLTPGPVVRSNDELIEAVRELSLHFDPAEVRAFKERFMSACDGHATERVVEWMINHVREQ